MNIVAKTERTILVPLQEIFEILEEEQEVIITIETNYRSWFHDPKVTQYNSHGLFQHGKRAMKLYRDFLEDDDIVAWAILVSQNLKMPKSDIPPKPKQYCQYKHIGNITLQKINWIYRSAEMAIVMGETDYWGVGYATEVLTTLFDHGFNRLNLHRIWSGTAKTNKGMIKVFEKLHMKHEGTFKDATFLNGEWADRVDYAVLRPNWNAINHNKFLEEK